MNGSRVDTSTYHCQICNIQLNSTKPSNIQRHLTSNNHKQEGHRLDQVGGLQNAQDQDGSLSSPSVNETACSDNKEERSAYTVNGFQITKDSRSQTKPFAQEVSSLSVISLKESDLSLQSQMGPPKSKLDMQVDQLLKENQNLQDRMYEIENQFTQTKNNIESSSLPSSLHDSVNSANGQLLNKIAAQSDDHVQCNKLIEELKSDKSKLEKKVKYSINEKDQLKREKDDLTDRFKSKEDYWSSLYMKMFTAAETNEGLAALFRTEGAQMRSQLTSVVHSTQQSPLPNSSQDNNNSDREDMIIDEDNAPDFAFDCIQNSNLLKEDEEKYKTTLGQNNTGQQIQSKIINVSFNTNSNRTLVASQKQLKKVLGKRHYLETQININDCNTPCQSNQSSIKARRTKSQRGKKRNAVDLTKQNRNTPKGEQQDSDKIIAQLSSSDQEQYQSTLLTSIKYLTISLKLD